MMAGDKTLWLWAAGVILIAAVLSADSVMLLRPLLQRYALARPNARSSHRAPTPQGGGIAVIASTIAIMVAAAVLFGQAATAAVGQMWPLLAATLLLAVIGGIDDLRPLPVAPRLLLQALAIAAALAALPNELRVIPIVPWWAERLFLLLALLWFVNLVNFMDGIDWMTVAEVVPLTAAIVVLGFLGKVAPPSTLLALALLGAIIGFAPFNRPVARLFLGDVGSLPIGLLLGWLLLQLAAGGAIAAALLLPLYYLADSTLTLLRRMAAGEPFWLAHRSHFYQRACDRGFSVTAIVGRVFATNLALAGLAIATAVRPDTFVIAGSVAIGAALVAWLLVTFARGKH